MGSSMRFGLWVNCQDAVRSPKNRRIFKRRFAFSFTASAIAAIKVYFAIHHESQAVRIFHVRHWAMKPAEADELEDLMDETNEAGT